MKNSTKNIVGFLLMAFALMFAPQQISAETAEGFIVSIAKDDLVGGWEYTVAGAPEGYDHGLLMIVNQGGVYRVQVQVNGGAINGDNVVKKGNKITFTLDVEGESVTVSLEAKGSKLSGTSTSASNGTMSITGVKSISPQ